jgi:hypothetical protein
MATNFESIVTFTRPDNTVEWPFTGLASYESYVEGLLASPGLIDVNNVKTDTQSTTTFIFDSDENRQVHRTSALLLALLTEMDPIMLERGVTKTVVDL